MSALIDVELERIVAAPLVDGPDATVEAIAGLVRASDFTDGLCSRVFSAACALHASGRERSWVLIADQAGLERGQVQRFWRESILVSSPASIAPHARKLADLGARRRLAIALSATLERANEHGSTIDELHASVSAALTDAAPPEPVEEPPDALELAEREYQFDWVVPHLLERRDRVVLTGPEGHGKSLLFRQLAVQLASGLHPFSRVDVPRATVLLVDLENSDAQVGRSLRRLTGIAGERYERGRLRVSCRTQGMDLRAPSDARWLDGVLAKVRPDVLVIGPLYKAFRTRGRESKNDETAAEDAASVLDRLRVRYGCALLIEAHSPHGDSGDRANWRPYGASLWLRWPEFGFGLKPCGDGEVELKPWRGMRDRDRRWPRVLAHGHRWPWEAVESKEGVA